MPAHNRKENEKFGDFENMCVGQKADRHQNKELNLVEIVIILLTISMK